MSTESKIAHLRAQWLARRAEDLDDVLRRCESPIERLFLLACLARDWRLDEHAETEEWDRCVWSIPSVAAAADGYNVPTCLEWRSGPDTADKCVCQLPVQIVDKRLRIDFAFFLCGARVAVELDGHDFHERTKEQARREKSRQRLLTADGWHVLRFTGSEVYRDADACAREVDDLPEKLWRARRMPA